MHALIMEEDAWIALMIEDALSDLGYTDFDIAASCEEALALASRKCPDLITSDVRLGAACGIETVRSICSDRQIPIVFITANSFQVLRRNADLAVVQKPFGVADLKDAIDQAIAYTPTSAW